MCGPATSDRPRGGALAVLLPSRTALDQCIGLNGDLSFFKPSSQSSSEATHVQLTLTKDATQSQLDDLFVMVHNLGDLRQSASDCGLMCTIPLQRGDDVSAGNRIEIELPEPLSLAVGGYGIIGRRVSVCCGNALADSTIVAEGIVGYNFSSQVQAAL